MTKRSRSTALSKFRQADDPSAADDGDATRRKVALERAVPSPAKRVERKPMALASLSSELKLPEAALAQPLNALRARGLVEERSSNEFVLTAAGAATRERVLAARRSGLADLLARWQPEQHPEVLALIDRLARALTSNLPALQAT
jgi:hypothetical protein